jgi:hypothetical protein
MNLNDVGTQLLFTTLPISVKKKDGAVVSGTAFFYSVPLPDKPGGSIPFLVTNYHLLSNVESGYLILTGSKGAEPDVSKKLRVDFTGDILSNNYDSELDLAAIPIGGTLNLLQSQNTPVFFKAIQPEIIPNSEVIKGLLAIEEVTFAGYPSGIYDDVNSTPLIRKGITASPIWNDFKGKPVFVIDAGVYPGSSGSPVFIYNQGSYATTQGITVGVRIYFLGIISSTFSGIGANSSPYFIGLGTVIKSQKIKEFIDGIVKNIKV